MDGIESWKKSRLIYRAVVLLMMMMMVCCVQFTGFAGAVV
jgi:hypothetical protein